MKLRIKRLDKDLPLPSYAKPGDSGLDLYASENTVVFSGQRGVIGTGVAVEIPQGYEVQVRPRSGRSLEGLDVCLGTIDNGYRGEIGVVVFNGSYGVITISKGERIAQMVVCPVLRPGVKEVEELGETQRGLDGFGSTGV